MQGLRASEIIDFTGGMNTVKAPYLIAPNESVLSINADGRKGALSSHRRPLEIKAMSAPYFFEFNGVPFEYGSWRANVIWDRNWYWTDGVFTGKKLPNGVDKDLGMDPPNSAPDVVVNSEEGPLIWKYQYVYTFYDNETGVESAPSPISTRVAPQDQTVTLSGFDDPGANNDATHYRIYRLGGYWPYFALVDMIPITDKDYTDALDDIQIDGRELQTLRNGPVPNGIKYFTELAGRF